VAAGLARHLVGAAAAHLTTTPRADEETAACES
jgi:hypothetical protein